MPKQEVIAKTSPKSRMLVWLTTPLLVLILYVVTWPPIEIKCARVTIMPGFTSSDGTTNPPFRWTQYSRPAFYAPLDALRASNGKHNAFARYWDWWREKLE